jgi:hypothetical protein
VQFINDAGRAHTEPRPDADPGTRGESCARARTGAVADTYTYTFSGIVTDGQGRPVTESPYAEVPIRGPRMPTAVTNFAVSTTACRATSIRLPVMSASQCDGRLLRADTRGQNLTVRRITGLTAISSGHAGCRRTNVGNTQVMFDTGAIETPVLK